MKGEIKMVKQEPLCCPYCGAIVLQNKNTLAFALINGDIRCPRCGKIVISAEPPWVADFWL